MVGPAHPGLVPAPRRLRSGPDGWGGARKGARENRRRLVAAVRPQTGRRRAGHVVLVVAVAYFGLRRHPQPRQQGDQLLLPHQRPGDGPRHHLLLGGAHDHGGLRIPRRKTLRQRLFHGHRPRQDRPQDVQAAGQLARPARPDRQIRRRRYAHGDAHLLVGRQRRDVRRGALRAGTQLRQQDMERLPPGERLVGGRQGRTGREQPPGGRMVPPDTRRRFAPDRRRFRLLPHFGGVQDGLQALLGRLQRPVPGDGETRLRAADRRADVRSHAHVLRLPDARAAPLHALRDGGDLARPRPAQRGRVDHRRPDAPAGRSRRAIAGAVRTGPGGDLLGA